MRPLFHRGAVPPAASQYQQLPFTSAAVDERDFAGEGSTASREPSVEQRHPLFARPRSSTASGAVLSSSFGQRTPARSFVNYASHGPLEMPQYASQGVRERTQELAAYHLSDHGSLPSPRSLPLSEPDAPYRGHCRLSSSEHGDVRTSMDSLQSNAIEEVSEPVSPETAAPAPRRGSCASGQARSMLVSSQEAPRAQEGRGGEDGLPRGVVPRVTVNEADARGDGLDAPLLPRARGTSMDKYADYGTVGDVEEGSMRRYRKRPRSRQTLLRVKEHALACLRVVANPKAWDGDAILQQGVIAPVRTLPAVFLGLLLNVLDGLSYGMILFPLGESIFANTAPDGISIFFVSCIVSQLVYSLGGSKFKGAVGSEMIEVVPFFHSMAYSIVGQMGTRNADEVLATVITSYALSSVITGLLFGALGAFKLGDLVSFFPKSLLLGCIGGVGFFLFVTGIEVSARLEGNFEYTLETLGKLFELDTVFLWTTPLLLAVMYMMIKHFYDHPAILPAFIVITTAVFHIAVAAIPSMTLDILRGKGWVFDKPEAGVPFWNFYTYYKFRLVDWSALAKTIPTMLALSFFGIIHVPINVPALAVAVKEDDVNVNRELVAHGLSNTLSGFAGSIQNYLVYVNSDMFYKHGGDNRLAGLLLAAATTAVWMAGPAFIGYVPVFVVGILIYYLGIELLRESLWETLGQLQTLEYLMTLVIVLVMGVYDFVFGIVAGIILACLIYVVQTSRQPAIRASYSGIIATSTVRRPPLERDFLRRAGRQIRVIKLAGYLFFGSIVSVEKEVRSLIEEESYVQQPIRYVTFDLQHVTGLDFSAGGAFKRMNRLLRRRQIEMVLSSVGLTDDVGKSLSNIGIFSADGEEEPGPPPPKVFEDLTTALEYCENGLLGALRESRIGVGRRKAEPVAIASGKQALQFQLANSPRRGFLQRAAAMTLSEYGSAPVDDRNVLAPSKWSSFAQPTRLMLQTFQGISNKNEDFWHRAAGFFERKEVPQGTVLYSRGDEPDGFYILEKGTLRAVYDLEQGNYYESIQAGTTCGELPFFSETDRTGTVSAESDCVAWLLTQEKFKELEKRHPDVAFELLKIGMKLTSERMNAITSYVLVTAG